MAGVYLVRLVSQFISVSRYKVIPSGRDSSFGTVEVRGLNPDVAEVYRYPSRPAPEAHPAFCPLGTGVSGRDVVLTTHSLLAPMLKKE